MYLLVLSIVFYNYLSVASATRCLKTLQTLLYIKNLVVIFSLFIVILLRCHLIRLLWMQGKRPMSHFLET